jgi:MFS family permease
MFGLSRGIVTTLHLSCAFFFFFASFNGAQSLESSLHESDPALGYWTVSLIYISLAFFTIPAPALVRHVGAKAGLCIGCTTYITFLLANIWPMKATLFPAAVLLGVGGATLWTAEGVYLARVARNHALGEGMTVDDALGRLNGLFFTIFQANTFMGNLATSLILRSGQGVTLLFYVFVGIAVFGFLVLTTVPVVREPGLAEQEKPLAGSEHGNEASASSVSPAAAPAGQPGLVELLTGTVRIMAKPEMLLLLPIVTFSGIALGFLTGSVSADVISACEGKGAIGYMFALCFGVDALASYLLGPLARRFGRATAVFTGVLAHLVFGLVLLMWYGHPGKHVNGGCFGVIVPGMLLFGWGDAVWNTQLMSITGLLFPSDSPSAFAAYRMANSIGFAIMCIIGPYRGFIDKAIIYLVSLGLSSAAFAFLVVRERRENRDKARL